MEEEFEFERGAAAYRMTPAKFGEARKNILQSNSHVSETTLVAARAQAAGEQPLAVVVELKERRGDRRVGRRWRARSTLDNVDDCTRFKIEGKQNQRGYHKQQHTEAESPCRRQSLGCAYCTIKLSRVKRHGDEWRISFIVNNRSSNSNKQYTPVATMQTLGFLR